MKPVSGLFLETEYRPLKQASHRRWGTHLTAQTKSWSLPQRTPWNAGVTRTRPFDLLGFRTGFIWINIYEALILNMNTTQDNDYVCMYVYSRGGPPTAPAPRPSLIYKIMTKKRSWNKWTRRKHNEQGRKKDDKWRRKAFLLTPLER
jgi:hypothetical protein